MLFSRHLKLFSEGNKRAFASYIHQLSQSEEVQRLRTFRHHKEINRYDHAMLVAFLSFALCRRWGWDDYAAARAGLLHDLFWSECDGTFTLCLNHPETACRNAEALTGGLSAKERNIILSHMWPAGRHLPRSREAWMVDLVDDLVCFMDLANKSQRYCRHLDRYLTAAAN